MLRAVGFTDVRRPRWSRRAVLAGISGAPRAWTGHARDARDPLLAVAHDVIASASCVLDEPVDPLDFVAAFPERQRFSLAARRDDEHVAAVARR